ncbi:MAG: hypothetical protein ABR538_10795 [Candidatus Binatia bacterium]
MIRRNPASLAIVLATGLVLATTTFAMAEEAAPAEPAPEVEYAPTIYFGPAIGYADQRGSEFGWSVQVLARWNEYIGVQIEYLNLGDDKTSSGDHDAVYFGLMPLLPVSPRVDLFGQLGLVVGDAGDDVAAGGGVLYNIPIEFFESKTVRVALRGDYKYLNVDNGEHMLMIGIMFGFYK